MRDVGCDAWSHADIIQGELANSWVKLQQEREWLADTTGGTEDSDLGVLCGVSLASDTFLRRVHGLEVTRYFRVSTSWSSARDQLMPVSINCEIHHSRKVVGRSIGAPSMPFP